jgi:hypothetical protein
MVDEPQRVDMVGHPAGVPPVTLAADGAHAQVAEEDALPKIPIPSHPELPPTVPRVQPPAQRQGAVTLEDLLAAPAAISGRRILMGQGRAPPTAADRSVHNQRASMGSFQPGAFHSTSLG